VSDYEYALLTAIRRNKRDYLPRLVYADWLEQTADRWNVLRAELIRCQVELERREPNRKWGYGWFSPAEKNFGTPEAVREKEILETYGCDLCQDLVDVLLPSGLRKNIDYGYEGSRIGLSWKWHNGLVSELYIDSRRFCKLAADIFSTRHAFEAVHLSDKRPGSLQIRQNRYEYHWVNGKYARQPEYQSYVDRGFDGTNVLSGVLFHFLPAELAIETGPAVYRTHDQDTARTALARACVTFGELKEKTARFRRKHAGQ
jgi:uncharacterized protein (TIGR02996 family)